MQFTWFDYNWSWIGLGISAVLLILLFTTNVFRSDPKISRWRDPVWLAWLGPAGYMLHQAEEYGMDALGNTFAFPDLLCASFSFPPYPDCIVPTATFVAINITSIWVAGLICGLLSWRHPLVGLSIYAIHGTNALAHLGTFAASGVYNPGSLTSALVQLPLFIWVAYAMSGNPAIRKSGIVTLFGAGILLSAVLLGSLKLFSLGKISGGALVTIQMLNPLLLIFVVWLKERNDYSAGLPSPNLS